MSTAVQQSPNVTASIFESAVALSLNISRLGNSKKLPKSLITVDCDSDAYKANKQLYACPELTAIFDHMTAIRSYVYSVSVPAFFVRDGVYLIKVAEVERVCARLDQMIADTEPLVDAFIAVYNAVVDNDARRLRAAYNPGDYFTRERARASFSVSYQLVEFGAPGQLRRSNPELFAAESAKLRDSFSNAAESIEQLLYAQTAELVDHAIDRLSGERDGNKAKIFRDSLTENLNEFAETLKARNITDSAELNDIADRLMRLLDGVDPKYLRKSADTRQELVRGFEVIKSIVDANMVDRPTRAFDLSDD
jgi:hypothetical protein